MHSSDPATQSKEPEPGSASIGQFAQGTSDYVRAWSALVASETRLASISALRLLFAALVIPALALVICITVDALVAALLERWLHDWSSSIAIVLWLDLMALGALLASMRRWLRNLSLPRSRGALTLLLKRLS